MYSRRSEHVGKSTQPFDGVVAFCGVALALLVSRCATARPFDPALSGEARYLCSTMRFNENGDASDANYAYPLYGRTLSVGTRVQVTHAGASYIAFSVDGRQGEYSLGFVYGGEHLSAAQYFDGILCAEDPTSKLDVMPEELRLAVREGRLKRGMTREEAITARGHPPAHVTPDQRSDTWVYFQSPGFLDRVLFSEGRIISVETIRAP